MDFKLYVKVFYNITVEGCLASDPLVLHRVGHALLQLSPLEPKRTRSIVIADDLFQFSKVPVQKTAYVISKTVEKLSGCKFHLFLQWFILEFLLSRILNIMFW